MVRMEPGSASPTAARETPPKGFGRNGAWVAWLTMAMLFAGHPGCGRDEKAHRGQGSIAAQDPASHDRIPRHETPDHARQWRAIRVAVASGDSARRSLLLAAWLDTLKTTLPYPHAHYGAGLVALALSADTMALTHLRAAVSHDPHDALCYTHLAEAARRTGKIDEIMEEIRDAGMAHGYSASRLVGLGLVLAEDAAWDSSLAYGERAAAVEPLWGEPQVLMARSLRGLMRLEEALHHAQRAVSLAALSGDIEVRVRSLDASGMALRMLGRIPDAGRAGTEALELCTRHSLRHLEYPLRCELGYLSLLRHDPASAELMLGDALTLAEDAGDLRSRGWALKLLGDARALQGDDATAEEFLARALDALRSVRDPEGPAACLDALAGVASRQGETNAAIARYGESLALHRDRGDRRAEAVTLANLGAAWLDHGEFAHAVACFHEAVDAATFLGDTTGVATASIGLGNAYMALNELDRAGDVVRRALVLATLRHDTTMTAMAQGALGALEFREGDTEKARQRFRAAAAMFERLGDRRSRAAAMLNLGMSQLAATPQAAEETLREAQSLAVECHDDYGQAAATAALGEVALRDGRHDEATSCFADCLDQATALHAPDIAWFAQYGLARCHEASGDPQASLALYESALSTIEETRRRLPVHEWRWGFLSAKATIHERYIRLLAALHDQEPRAGWAGRAFNVAERVKARAFLDLLSDAESRMLGFGGPRSSIGDSLVREISRLSQTLWRLPRDSPRAAQLRQEVAARENELDRLRLSTEAPLSQMQWRDVQEVFPACRDAMSDAGIEALLEYFIGENESFLWVITPDTLVLRALPSRERLTELIAPLIEMTGHPPRVGVEDEPWRRRLAEQILPIDMWREGVPGRICIVPDGALFYVAFECLPAGAEGADSASIGPLIEACAVSYAPSTAILLSLWQEGRTRGEGKVLAMGIEEARRAEGGVGSDWSRIEGFGSATQGLAEAGSRLPRLRYAEAEAETVCASFDAGRCTVLIGAEATEGRLVGELQQPYAIAHLATHTLIDMRAPRRSCIALNPGPDPGDDGALVFDEIIRLNSSPGFVVLSSCESAMGEVVSGEGMVSLSRAFFHTGATGMLVTLWPVDDRSTAQWMREFYRGVAAGDAWDAAARKAKLSFIHGNVPALRHPYYWAPFVLIGRV